MLVAIPETALNVFDVDLGVSFHDFHILTVICILYYQYYRLRYSSKATFVACFTNVITKISTDRKL